MPSTADPASVKNVSAEEVRALLDTAKHGQLTLLDVRMEPEYEAFHLPGARLLPLPDLPDHLGEVPKDKPVVVYCRSGRRSAAAATLLAGAGFPEIINMLGGAMAWQGAAASGTPDTGMTLLSGNETPEQILRRALGMEAALGAFYTRLAASAADTPTKETCTRLAAVEDRHLHRIHTLYRQATGDASALDSLLADASPLVEGGRPAEDFLQMLGGTPESPTEALELASAVEAQALDLYARLAQRAEAAESVTLLTTLAQEEKAHLKAVSNLLRQQAATSNP